MTSFRSALSRTRAAFFVLVLASGATACASKPTMKLNHAEISGMRIAFPPSIGIVMTAVVDVYNPNGYDVAVRAMRGQIVMADKYIVPLDFRASGDGVWLGSEATTQMRVPVNIPVPMALAMIGEAFAAVTIPFRITGSADVTASRTFKIEKDNYSVNEIGSISRQQIEAALRGGF